MLPQGPQKDKMQNPYCCKHRPATEQLKKKKSIIISLQSQGKIQQPEASSKHATELQDFPQRLLHLVS